MSPEAGLLGGEGKRTHKRRGGDLGRGKERKTKSTARGAIIIGGNHDGPWWETRVVITGEFREGTRVKPMYGPRWRLHAAWPLSKCGKGRVQGK